MLTQGPDQDERGQLVALAAGVVTHRVLQLFIGQRHVAAFAKLIALDVVGVHQHHGDARFLADTLAKLGAIGGVDECKLMVALEAGTEIETVNAADTLAANFVKKAVYTERTGDSA